MAEYIELNELQKFCRKYTEVDAVGLILADRTDLISTADVIERSKVDKAIMEIENELNSGLWNDVFCRGLKYALKILKKYRRVSMDYTIDGIVIPVHKKRTFKCFSCGGTMEKVNEYPIGPQFQAHEPYYMDRVTYRCHNCIATMVKIEHRTDKFGNWIEHKIIGE